MKREDVPQDPGLLGPWHYLTYAVDEKGLYTPVASAGWDPIRVANGQAWERVRAQVEGAIQEIRAGKASPLAYHLARNLMDPPLFARYARVSARKVRRHLTPRGFARADDAIIARYAEILGVTPEDLRSPALPEPGERP